MNALPAAEFQFEHFEDLTDAQVRALPNYPDCVQVRLDPRMIKRKVWAWIFSTSPTFEVDAHVEFHLQQVAVFSRPVIRWNSSTLTNNWVAGLSGAAQTVLAAPDLFITRIGNNYWAVEPFEVTLACDFAHLHFDVVSGAASPVFNAGLYVQSEIGRI